MKLRKRTATIAFAIYGIVLIISPIFFGSVHTYAYSFVMLLILFASLVIPIDMIRNDNGRLIVRLPKIRANWFFFGILAYLIFQIMPIPSEIVKLISPEAWRLEQMSVPATQIDKYYLSWSSIVPYSFPVRMSLVRLLCYGLLYYGLVHVLNSRNRIEKAIFCVLAICSAEALYGVSQLYDNTARILWYAKGNDYGIHGTYINRNHFAGFMIFGVLLATAYLVSIEKIQTKKTRNKNFFKNFFSIWISAEQDIGKRLIALTFGILAGIGLALSSSRGAIISALLGILTMAFLNLARKGFRIHGSVIILYVMVILIALGQIGIDVAVSRFSYINNDFYLRYDFCKNGLDIIKDYPITGIGVGNFQYVYPKYQSVLVGFLEYLHNDWMQFLLESGIVGFGIFCAGLSYYLYGMILMYYGRRNPFAIGIGCGVIAIILAISIHSIVDFSLHMPSNAITLVAIMAIGDSALHIRTHNNNERYDNWFGYFSIPLKYKGAFVILLILLTISWGMYTTIRHFMAEANCNTEVNSTMYHEQYPSSDRIDKAISWDKHNDRYWYKRAVELTRIKHQNSDKLTDVQKNEIQKQIVTDLEEAVRLNPLNPEYHLRLGWMYSYLWQEVDYYEKWLPSADISMLRAAYVSGKTNPHIYVEIGNYWVMRYSNIDENNRDSKQRAWKEACNAYKKALQIESNEQITKDIITYVTKYLPENPMEILKNQCKE